MKCLEAKNYLHKLAGNSLSSNVEIKDAIEFHLTECPKCFQEFNALQTMLKLMHQLPVPEKSDQQWQSLQDSIILALDNASSSNSSLSARNQLFTFPTLSVRKWAIAALIVISTVSVVTYFALSSVKQNAVTTQNTSLPKIIDINGEAYSINSSTQKPLDIQNAELNGNILRTASKASLRIQTDHKSFIDIAENSSLQINKCSEKEQLFTLKQGIVTAQVGKRKTDQIYRISTSNAICEVIGTRFRLSCENQADSEKCITTLYVLQGKVLFRLANGTSSQVDSGYSAVAKNNTIISLTADNQKTRDSNLPEKHNVLKTGQKHSRNTVEFSVHDSLTKNTKKSGTLSSVSSLIESGKLDEAIAELRKIQFNRNIAPGILVSALQKEALCWKMKKDYSQAIKVLEAILKTECPDDQKESALFQIASIRRSELNDFDAAINDLIQYTTLYPNGILAEEASFTLAELYQLKKNYDNAIKVYRTIIDKYPQSTRFETALYSLARIYSSSMNDCDHALGIYSRIELQFPDGILAEDASFWKAECLFQQKKINQSIAAYHQYLQKYPNGKWVTEARLRSGSDATAGKTK